MTDPGARPHLVTIQRATVTLGTLGGETRSWSTHATGWARVRYGTGQERREAAQENASVSATFEFDWNPTLAAVKTLDRLSVFDTVWDIASVVTIGGRREVHMTATANLDPEMES